MTPSRLRLTLLLTAVFTLLTGLLTSPVLARDPLPEINGQRVRYYNQVFEPAIQSQDVNLQSTVFEIYLSLVSSIFRATYQCDAACSAAIGVPATGSLTPDEKLANRPKGLIPELVYSTTALVSQPPVSSTNYIAYVGKKLHLVQPAYAQAGALGFGYEGLAPTRQIWTAFRNIAYLLATIGFVVLSFMIMFRLKISAQTVIGAQQAIMKLIVVFLAVTFSYAIAGLLIDLIFIFTFVIITLFTSTGLVGPDPATVQSELLKGNIFQTFGALLGAIDQGGVIFTQLSQQLVGAVDPFGILQWVNNLFSGGIDIIFALIIGIAVIYALIRLLFALLMSYLEIIILTILAPIMILPDILPGGTSFTNWLKRLFANAMVFPTTAFMLLLGIALVGPNNPSWGLTGATPPDFDTGVRLPFLGQFTGAALQTFLGVGMILLTYKVVDMVKNALKVQAFPYSSAIGAALGYGAGRAGAIGGAMASPVTMPAGFMGKTISDQARAGIRSIAREKTAQYAGRIPGVKQIMRRGQAAQTARAQGVDTGRDLDSSLD